MTTNSSTAAPAEAGHVSLMTGRMARARRSAGVVRYTDAAGRTRTASPDVASTFVELSEFDLDRDQGVALIEAAGQGVRILVAITVDQFDAAFDARPWPIVGPGQLHGSVDSIRVAVSGQWYSLSRVQMPSGERRRFASQYNGYGDGTADVREASMMFGCAWSSVPVVGWTEAEIEAEHEADAERMDYLDRTDADIAADERDAEHRHAADDEAARAAEDAARAETEGTAPGADDSHQHYTDTAGVEWCNAPSVHVAEARADEVAAELHAEFTWGTDPAEFLAEPDVDTSGCSNPWHRTAALYGRRACPECPPAVRPVETVELPPDPPHAAGAGPAVTTDRTDPQT